MTAQDEIGTIKCLHWESQRAESTQVLHEVKLLAQAVQEQRLLLHWKKLKGFTSLPKQVLTGARDTLQKVIQEQATVM